MELRGTVLGGRYLLERRIAAGGMGQVWLAMDEVLGRLVAVKLLRPGYAEHPETLERFRSEARHAAALSHPHIAQVYDYGHAGPGREPYLVLEYVDGPSLADVIERGPLAAGDACDVVAQAASGLAAAHLAGLVHRDVKPGNMLLTSCGLVKVADFGIAHAAGSAPITAPGIVMGTSLYMAPERIAGGSGTPASDLYSLGIVLWECLTGRPPFQGTPADVMAAHLHQALPPLPDHVPLPLCGLVARLTAKDPAYRLSNASLLATHLRIMDLAGAGVPGTGSRPRGGRPRQGTSRARGGLPRQRAPSPLPASPVVGHLSAPVADPTDARKLDDARRLADTGQFADVLAGAPLTDNSLTDDSLADDSLAGDSLAAELAPGADYDSGAVARRVPPALSAPTGSDAIPGRPASGNRTGPARSGGRRPGVTVTVAAVVVAGIAAGGLAAAWPLRAAPPGPVISVRPDGPGPADRTITVTHASDSPTTLPPGAPHATQARGPQPTSGSGTRGATPGVGTRAGASRPAGPTTAASGPAGPAPGTPGSGTPAPSDSPPATAGSPGTGGQAGSGSTPSPTPTSTCHYVLGLCLPIQGAAIQGAAI